jgi:phosphoribosylglycinamide formyltransferase-1
MLNIAVLVSGGGTNLEALIKAEKSGEIKNGRIALVLSSRAGAFALERAKRNGIKTAVVERKNYASAEDFDSALVAQLKSSGIDLVVLAGFMQLLGEPVIRAFKDRIINVHPALIPSFCGKGYYGLKVHEAALEYGVKITGATVHFVDEVADGGAVILQKAVEIMQGDTPESLQRRVMEEAEWVLLPRAVSLFCEGRIRIEGRKTFIE